MTGANGEVSFINIKTLNEWDSRVRKNEIPKLALTASLLPDTPGTAGKTRQTSGGAPWVVTFHQRHFGGLIRLPQVQGGWFEPYPCPQVLCAVVSVFQCCPHELFPPKNPNQCYIFHAAHISPFPVQGLALQVAVRILLGGIMR